MVPELVVVGVSAGGLDALCALLGGMPEPPPFPLVMVQHRSRDSEVLCEVLQRCGPTPVIEVTDKAAIEPGQAFLAPADYHLLVERGSFSLSLDAPERFSRPSIDVAFESAARAYGSGLVGVVLTGANADGARGLRTIVDRGGGAVVQDPDTAEVAIMPRAALERVPEATVLPIAAIAAHLLGLAGPTARPEELRG